MFCARCKLNNLSILSVSNIYVCDHSRRIIILKISFCGIRIKRGVCYLYNELISNLLGTARSLDQNHIKSYFQITWSCI